MWTRALRSWSAAGRRGGSGARVPEGERIYAVGDIHGRDDLLRRIHDLIGADRRDHPAPGPCTVVYLGDYVDRGSGSREVLDILIREPIEADQRVHLQGNHELMMLRFLDGQDNGSWLLNGGDATLASYGVPAAWSTIHPQAVQGLSTALARELPPEHDRFLRSLELRHMAGDYVFVHAGVRPGIPLADQRPADLMWIREPFLGSTEDFGKRVVHGHTITSRPQVRANRIGIDTGAFGSGILSCLVLEGDQVRFLST
ncbi:MAG: serine/threonine protein phosphatase [Rhodospirillales bacterium]|nr:MAG: serine/threonine protein phosphatase [Rhodospirillales bacterium]